MFQTYIWNTAYLDTKSILVVIFSLSCQTS